MSHSKFFLKVGNYDRIRLVINWQNYALQLSTDKYNAGTGFSEFHFIDIIRKIIIRTSTINKNNNETRAPLLCMLEKIMQLDVY